MWHNPSQQYIICAPEGTQKPWTGWPGECLHLICDLFPLVQMSCGSLTPFSTYLHVTHKMRTRKHPQKSVFNRGDLPPFAEDGIGDNFSSRFQFRWSSSYTRHVFPSFSSCFLTQKKQGQPLRQHVVVLLRVMYVTWGGCSWLWVFFENPAFFSAHHTTAQLQLPLSLLSCFFFLFFKQQGKLSLLKEACERRMVTTTLPLFPVPSPTTAPGSPFSTHCTHAAPACQQHSLLCTYRYRFLSLIMLASVFISFAPSYLLQHQ